MAAHTAPDSTGARDAGGPLPFAPHVLVFDVNDTLLNIDSLTPLFKRIFGERLMVHEWFNQLVMYSMTLTLAGHYIDFLRLGQGVLQMAADIRGAALTHHDLAAVKHAMLTMPAHADVEEGLTTLRDSGFRLVTLTNSPPNPDGPSPLEHAGPARLIERQFSIDACRTFKPDRQVYEYVCRELGVVPAQCMMVAAHAWDTLGAQSAGFSAALITRPGNAPLVVGDLPRPTLVATDLIHLARQLSTARSFSGTRVHPGDSADG